MLALVPAAYAGAFRETCFDQLSVGHSRFDSEWKQHGSMVERREIPRALRGRPLLARVEESGVDVDVQVLNGAGAPVAQADSPVDRSAVQYLYVPREAGGAVLVATAHGPQGLGGSVRVTYLDADVALASAGTEGCAAALRKWADADTAYSRGRSITSGRVSSADAGVARTAFEAAAATYKEALKALPGPAHTSERGQLELALAAVSYQGLKDWAGGVDWAKAAAVSFADAREPYRHARAQAIEAEAEIELATRSRGQGQTARTPAANRAQLSGIRTLLTQLSEFHAARHEDYDRALQIDNIGLAYVYEARFESAIPYFSQAQREFERVGDTTAAALAVQNIAYCDWGMGRLSAALTKFDRALELMPATTRPDMYLLTLDNSGLAHYAAGRFDESLRLHTQAMDLAIRIQSDLGRERSDYGLGVTYYAIGDAQLSADFLRRGLQIATPELDARTRVAMLRALAQIESESGHLVEAISHDSEALRLASAASARARILLRLAQDYAAQGDGAGARRILDELVAYPPNQDDLVRAMARVQRARLLHAAGSTQLAEKDLIEGIRTFDRLDSLADRFDARVELARVYVDEGRSNEALALLRRALAYSHEIGGQTANPEYRASIIHTLRPALSLAVDLLRAEFDALVQQGRLSEAQVLAVESLAAVDRDRATGFQEWRAEYFEQHSDTELAHLLSASSALYRDMAERRTQLAVRQDRGGTDDPAAKALREDIARLRVRLGVITSEIAKRSGGVNESASSAATPATVSSVERALEPGHAVIEYWLGSSHAYAWIVRNNRVEWIKLSTTEDINRASRTLQEVMHSPATVAVRRAACEELYQLVLRPMREAVATDRDLTLVPDGALHYAPFAALRDPGHEDSPYLVQTFDLSIAPALRFVPKPAAVSRPAQEAAASRVLIVADPIYTAGDPRVRAEDGATARAHPVRNDSNASRVTDDLTGLVRLESTAREASQIRALFSAERVDLLEGAEATREAVLAKDLARYRFIHIASHGVIDSEIPQLSALILGTYGSKGPVTDPYLRAADLLTRTFHAQAVVLSACDTALGKEYGSEGLVGLRYAALARGAHSVVASLWPVSDAIAARLMTDMYRGIIGSDQSSHGHARAGSLDVAHALAVAMREQLANTPALDPALWAPFTVYVGGE